MSITNDILGVAIALEMTPELAPKMLKAQVAMCIIILRDAAERIRILEGAQVADIIPLPICGGNVVPFVRP